MNHEHLDRVPRPAEEPTEKFFRELEQSGALPRGVTPERAMSAVLCALTRRLSGGVAHELVDSAPPTLRALIDHCVRGRGEHPEIIDRQTFLHYVADDLGVDMGVAEQVARAVFATLRARLPAEEVAHIDAQLPRGLLKLWQREA
jgi:uncharacterized protein (DUF2267 family)